MFLIFREIFICLYRTHVNIEVTDKPQWGNNCTQCLGCYHICPLHAVQYGKATRAKGQYKRFLKK